MSNLMGLLKQFVPVRMAVKNEGNGRADLFAVTFKGQYIL